MIYTGLIGWPLEHSLSPKIHNIAFEISGISGRYDLLPIAPNSLKELEKILHQLKNKQIMGLNVTIPHKINVIPFLDELEGDAERYQATNTVFLRNEKLIGENTDGIGFMRDLETGFGRSIFHGKGALIFGAGGSAKVVLAKLIDLGMYVTIAVRNREQALDQLSKLTFLTNHNSLVIDKGQLTQRNIDEVNLIINATPLGMHPAIDGIPIADELRFNQDQYIYDLVYNPYQTRLIKKAIVEGAKARNGFGMLVEQALLAFEIWTGINISREEFYNRYQHENGANLP